MALNGSTAWDGIPPGEKANHAGWHWMTIPGMGTRPMHWIGGGQDGTWDVRDGRVGLTPAEVLEDGWVYRMPCPLPPELVDAG